MAKKTLKQKMISLCFRTEPDLVEVFWKHCKDTNQTRSEGFRTIFNEHIIKNFLRKEVQQNTNNLKLEEHETPIH